MDHATFYLLRAEGLGATEAAEIVRVCREARALRIDPRAALLARWEGALADRDYALSAACARVIHLGVSL